MKVGNQPRCVLYERIGYRLGIPVHKSISLLLYFRQMFPNYSAAELVKIVLVSHDKEYFLQAVKPRTESLPQPNPKDIR